MNRRLAATLLCGLLLAACGGGGGTQTEDPAKALNDAGAAIGRLKTVSATLKFTSGTLSFRGFQLVSAEAQVRLPSSSDTTYLVREKDVQIGLEAIIIDGRVYLRVPFSGITELTGADAGAVPDLAKLFDPGAGLPAVVAAGQHPKNLGIEKVAGVDSQKVEATFTAAQVKGMLAQLDSAGDVDAQVWIGTSDHLVRKAVLTGAFGDGGTPATVEVDLKGFDRPVVITSPPAATPSPSM